MRRQEKILTLRRGNGKSWEVRILKRSLGEMRFGEETTDKWEGEMRELGRTSRI